MPEPQHPASAPTVGPDAAKPPPAASGADRRSFAPKDEGPEDQGYETDTTSRNDAEGATALASDQPSDAALDALKEKDGFLPDDISRNDAEGASALAAAPAAATSEDDPETRNLKTSERGGGSR